MMRTVPLQYGLIANPHAARLLYPLACLKSLPACSYEGVFINYSSLVDVPTFNRTIVVTAINPNTLGSPFPHLMVVSEGSFE